LTTRIELDGRLVRKPDLRVTPAGTHALRLEVDCGAARDHLLLEVVMVGAETPELSSRLRVGDQIRATGSIRARIGARLGIEVMASRIEPVTGEAAVSKENQPIVATR
jgi:primosomal replication protein N